jgi:hypothetical protein
LISFAPTLTTLSRMAPSFFGSRKLICTAFVT